MFLWVKKGQLGSAVFNSCVVRRDLKRMSRGDFSERLGEGFMKGMLFVWEKGCV